MLIQHISECNSFFVFDISIIGIRIAIVVQ